MLPLSPLGCPSHHSGASLTFHTTVTFRSTHRSCCLLCNFSAHPIAPTALLPIPSLLQLCCLSHRSYSTAAYPTTPTALLAIPSLLQLCCLSHRSYSTAAYPTTQMPLAICLTANVYQTAASSVICGRTPSVLTSTGSGQLLETTKLRLPTTRLKCCVCWPK